MSKISLTPNASGTGTLSIASPSTNSDYTLTLPAETGTVLTSGGAIDVNASAPADSVAIDASGNVGVGTSSPGAKLNIDGAASDAVVLFTNNGTSSAGGNGLRLGIDNSLNAYLNNTKAGPLVFYTSNAERMRIDSSGNLLFNSGYGSAATAYGCRAWVNFDGTGTVAIRGSGNVSSITDNGTGDYTVNFSTAMPDVNYCFSICDSYYGLAYQSSGMTTTSIRVFSADSGFALRDTAQISVAIFR